MVSNAKVKLHYVDDETGMSRDNCHPRFAQLAAADFYDDGADQFSPFGNDAGHDTLSALQGWYRDGGRDRDIGAFLRRFLAGWDYPVPKNMLQATPDKIAKWLALDDMHERYLSDECKARIATAFGQLRISGDIKAAMLDEGMLGLHIGLWLNARARAVYPDWKYADIDKERLLAMQAVLEQVRAGKGK